MSDSIKHHCGIALIRLKHPLRYYADKYGNPLWAFNRLFLLLEKQHNRGQDGAGIGCVKFEMPLGQNFMFRDRESRDNSLARLFKRTLKSYDKMKRQGTIYPEFPETVKEHFDFGGELLFGHLRYRTSGGMGANVCHPYYRRSNWTTRNLMLSGNFNMTNADELHQTLINRGQHPIFGTDTQTVLEEIGFHLDEAHDEIYHRERDAGTPGDQIPNVISEQLDLVKVLSESAKVWDGGYTISGAVGNGDCFVMRDPRGIRPAFWFENDEIVAFASERVPLMTVFDLAKSDVQEVPPGHVVTIKRDGKLRCESFAPPQPRSSCSFERIYFSRGNDPDIYQERKRLGGSLAGRILKAIDGDLGNSVFSFIPNTAETASYGLLDELRRLRRVEVQHRLREAVKDNTLVANFEQVVEELILSNWPRAEKIAHKDIKLRTFIANEEGRSKMVSHIYDITYDVVAPDDNLVVLDDSIVRGTTLRESIIGILTRTQPKRIIIASTAPQIRYPDCYGIDMSSLGKFVAFQAAVKLIKEKGKDPLLADTYRGCLAELKKPAAKQRNVVCDIYEPFSDEEISARIAQLLYPSDRGWKGDLTIVYQSIGALHAACPEHSGDWYFSGQYPTPGGTAICNRAFVDYYEKNELKS
jgi:amidophosphoribosyltransferase|tara:strand:- start:25214 stop:27133 length:1920 start_codon:yes stop_codon:yes gene_type:complete